MEAINSLKTKIYHQASTVYSQITQEDVVKVLRIALVIFCGLSSVRLFVLGIRMWSQGAACPESLKARKIKILLNQARLEKKPINEIENSLQLMDKGLGKSLSQIKLIKFYSLTNPQKALELALLLPVDSADSPVVKSYLALAKKLCESDQKNRELIQVVLEKAFQVLQIPYNHFIDEEGRANRLSLFCYYLAFTETAVQIDKSLDEALKSQFTSNKNNIDILSRFAKMLEEFGEEEKSKTFFFKALGEVFVDPKNYAIIAKHRFKNNQIIEALKQKLKGAEKDSRPIKVLSPLATFYRYLDDKVKERKVLNKIDEKELKTDEAITLALNLATVGEKKKAEKLLQELTDRLKSNLKVKNLVRLCEISKAYKILGDKGKEKACLSLVKRPIEIEDDLNWLKVATHFHGEGEIKLAKEIIRELNKKTSTRDFFSRGEIINCLVKLGEKSQAETLLQQMEKDVRETDDETKLISQENLELIQFYSGTDPQKAIQLMRELPVEERHIPSYVELTKGIYKNEVKNIEFIKQVLAKTESALQFPTEFVYPLDKLKVCCIKLRCYLAFLEDSTQVERAIKELDLVQYESDRIDILSYIAKKFEDIKSVDKSVEFFNKAFKLVSSRFSPIDGCKIIAKYRFKNTQFKEVLTAKITSEEEKHFSISVEAVGQLAICYRYLDDKEKEQQFLSSIDETAELKAKVTLPLAIRLAELEEKEKAKNLLKGFTKRLKANPKVKDIVDLCEVTKAYKTVGDKTDVQMSLFDARKAAHDLRKGSTSQNLHEQQSDWLTIAAFFYKEGENDFAKEIINALYLALPQDDDKKNKNQIKIATCLVELGENNLAETYLEEVKDNVWDINSHEEIIEKMMKLYAKMNKAKKALTLLEDCLIFDSRAMTVYFLGCSVLLGAFTALQVIYL